jgi:two-component system, OmpR family, response regulator QseB
MVNEEHLAILRGRIKAWRAWDPEQLPRAAGRTVVKDALEERLCSFGESVTPNALEAAVSRSRQRRANAAAGVRAETKRGIGYRLVVGEDA